jgi:hypothetical protein
MSARYLPGDVRLRMMHDAGGWYVFRTRSDDEPQVPRLGGQDCGCVFRARPDGHRIAGPLDGGRWPTRGAAVAAIRAADGAVMPR